MVQAGVHDAAVVRRRLSSRPRMSFDHADGTATLRECESSRQSDDAGPDDDNHANIVGDIVEGR